jgi:hypothetical protein
MRASRIECYVSIIHIADSMTKNTTGALHFVIIGFSVNEFVNQIIRSASSSTRIGKFMAK